MTILLRAFAVILVAVAVFLIVAVIRAVGSEGGARTGVAVLYIVISVALVAGAVFLWRGRGRGTRSA